MKRHVVKDLYPAVQIEFLRLASKSGNGSDEVWNMAKEIVEFKAKCAWIEFCHKYRIGHFWEGKDIKCD